MSLTFYTNLSDCWIITDGEDKRYFKDVGFRLLDIYKIKVCSNLDWGNWTFEIPETFSRNVIYENLYANI